MIRALIVDDEQAARDRLRQLLSSAEDITFVAEAENGDQALEKILETQPDLVFLDIHMPGRSGLEVAASLQAPRPKIIFCTAFDQYAIEAFELHAVDYLLKPVSRARLAQSVDRVRESIIEIKKLRGEIESAREVQARLFPQALPQMKNLDYSGICVPANAVGGDYYDFLLIGPHKLGVALGDVSGKGVSAALLMASLQGKLQSHAPRRGDAVAELATDLNRMVCNFSDSSRFITLFYGVYDDIDRTLTYVNAGHNPPLLFRPNGSWQILRLETGGTVIGLFPEAAYLQETLQLHAGDILIIFTDGITEAINIEQEEFGESRLRTLTTGHYWFPGLALRDLILAEVRKFTLGGQQQDDLSLVVAKIL